jgi:digeranylgeranylglycerophospholipid reductase
MSSIQDREVIIIGAGPAGATAAYELARAGIHPLLLEKDRVPGERNACAGGLAYPMKRRLELPDEVVDKEISVTRLVGRGKTREYRTSRPQFISVRRSVFDRYLAFRARDAGAELLTSHRVTKVERGTNVVSALDLERREKISFRAPLVLFADGPLTRARVSPGLGCSPREMVAAVVCELADPGNSEEAFELYFGEGRGDSGYFWNFPKKDSLNIGMGRIKRFVNRPLVGELDEFIRRHPRFRGKAVIRRQAGLVPTRSSRRFSGEGVMLLGDAAGLVDPLTGGGLVYAIASGEFAARAARSALAARSFRAEDLYDAYDRAWRRTNYWRWLKLMAVPYCFVEWRTSRGRYSWYPEIIRALLALSFRSLRLFGKL